MAAKFEISKDRAGKFRFHLKAPNGEIIAASQGYESKASADKGIAEIDPRTLPRLYPRSEGPRTVVETGVWSRALLDPLEAGEPVRLEGRSLRRWVDLRRDQRFEWFEVRPDDTVVRSGVAGS